MDIAVFVSGGGTNLQAIIDNIRTGVLSGVRIRIVIASKEGIYAIERSRAAGIPYKVISRKQYPEAEEFHAVLTDALKPYKIDLVVLAGYLSRLSERFIDEYRNRIINIHPALIPSFCGEGMYGIRPHIEAIRRGVKITGATVHFVDRDYDNGPIILQKPVEVLDDDTPESLQARVMDLAEQIILPEAVRLIRDNRVSITSDGRRTRLKDQV